MKRTYTGTTREVDYVKRLWITILAIIILVVIGLLSLTTFAPQVGFLFGLISKYRNDMGDEFVVMPNSPIFTDVPNSVKDPVIGLRGYAQPGTSVVLYINGPEKNKVVTDNEGIFTFTDVKLIIGKNTLFAKAYDSKQNESEKSKVHFIIVDNENPKIEIEEPKSGETIKNLNNRIEIKGKVSEKSTITVNDGLVVQKPDFTFEYLLGVKEGDVKIKIKAKDEAGNESTKELSVKYEND